MIETYRMLGREHELDLEREARRRALARVSRPRRPGRFRLGLIARLIRVAPAEGLAPLTQARGGGRA
jgi:hypothetical protein